MENKVTKKERSNMAAELGRRGGLSVSKSRGKDYMKRIGKRGGKARWNKKEIKN